MFFLDLNPILCWRFSILRMFFFLNLGWNHQLAISCHFLMIKRFMLKDLPLLWSSVLVTSSDVFLLTPVYVVGPLSTELMGSKGSTLCWWGCFPFIPNGVFFSQFWYPGNHLRSKNSSWWVLSIFFKHIREITMNCKVTIIYLYTYIYIYIYIVCKKILAYFPNAYILYLDAW